MWFNKVGEGESPIIQRVEVGRGSQLGTFESNVSNLPHNENLMVCAFVEMLVENQRLTLIGDEVDFRL